MIGNVTEGFMAGIVHADRLYNMKSFQNNLFFTGYTFLLNSFIFEIDSIKLIAMDLFIQFQMANMMVSLGN